MGLGRKVRFFSVLRGACLLPLLLFAHAGVAQVQAPVRIAPEMNMQSGRYGPEHWQTFSFLSPRRVEAAPVVVRLEGVRYDAPSDHPSLEYLPAFLYDNGTAYVTIPARPRGKGTAADQANDLARAIAEITENSRKYRIDPTRIILVGAGLEAQTALLVATNPTYLTNMNVPFTSVRAAISIDGEPFDIPSWLTAGGAFRQGKYRKLFGSGAEAQLLLSPTRHAEAPNARAFLFLVSKGKSQLLTEATQFASALSANGSVTDVLEVSRMQPDVAVTFIGAPQHQQTPLLSAFLRAVTGE